MRLADGHFLSVIESTPLVSVDLLLFNQNEEILLGRRRNRPAQGYWFVPGGRIHKNETIKDAFERISESELGVRIDFASASLRGAYDHIYSDNVYGLNKVNTHYVVIAYQARFAKDPGFTFDKDHGAFRWWSVEQLLLDKRVHKNTKNYFLPAE